MRQPRFTFLTTKVAEVSADQEHGGEQDADEKVFFRQEERKKDAESDPEKDKPHRFFHNCRILLPFYIKYMRQK